jgi:O-antigen ligase
MTFLLARRRFGIVPALVVAAGLFAASSALHFSGGRDISADSGKDRAALWGEGLQIVKSHPIFGVGFGLMGDHTDNHQTAHNSVVVCSAELGLFGLYFWSLFLLPSLRDALVIASPEKVSEAKPMVIEKSPFPGPPWKFSAVDKAEINNLGNLVFLSLIGFLVTGWFLSRAFVTTMFLLGGMAEVVYEMALRRGMVAPRLRLGRVAFYSGVFTISLLVLVYGMLRVLNLLNFAD